MLKYYLNELLPTNKNEQKLLPKIMVSIAPEASFTFKFDIKKKTR